MATTEQYEMRGKLCDELLSGNRKKCVGDLKIGDTYCAVGTLFDVAGLDVNSPHIYWNWPSRTENLLGMSPYRVKRLVEISDSTQGWDDVVSYIKGLD